MAEETLKNIALLIDADNIEPESIDPVLTVMAELGQVNIRRAYGNFSKPGLQKWGTLTHRYGIQPRQQFDMTRGKNATDMAMVIDAIDLLYQGKVDGFGIMSSDSDFTPLITRLRQDGLVVYGFGKDKTPEAFKSACTRFLDVDKLQRTVNKEEQPESQPPVKLSPDSDTVDAELIELLGAAWKAAKRDEDGFAKLEEVGQIAGNRSSFDVRNHGFKRLSELFRATGNFQLEKRENKQLYVKRLR